MRYTWLLAMVSALVLGVAAVGMAAPKSGSADLTISKTDGPDPVGLGTPLTYTMQVQNLGPDPASRVIVTDELPKGVDFVSATASPGQCSRKGRKVTCALGGLNAPTVNYGPPPTVTLTVVPRKVGTITNRASVKGDQKDPVGASNKAAATTSVVGPAATCRGVAVTIAGTAGNDTIAGTGSRDVIATFGGDDAVFSLAGRDLVCAGAGSDYVGAGTAADRVFGGAGDDRLLGRGGPDVLKGNRGNDALKGNRGNDALKGNRGNDALKGNRGADRLRGGSGSDRCRGGAGADSIRGCER